MENKMTAVEWLLNILITENEITLKGENYKLFDMAIRMEKEQIKNAYDANRDINTIQTAEQYYDENYLSKKIKKQSRD
jgi:hypothetical protein